MDQRRLFFLLQSQGSHRGSPPQWGHLALSTPRKPYLPKLLTWKFGFRFPTHYIWGHTLKPQHEGALWFRGLTQNWPWRQRWRSWGHLDTVILGTQMASVSCSYLYSEGYWRCSPEATEHWLATYWSILYRYVPISSSIFMFLFMWISSFYWLLTGFAYKFAQRSKSWIVFSLFLCSLICFIFAPPYLWGLCA